MPAQKVGVNLLPQSEFEQTFWGRFLKWAISTGRYILILVELVVIIAFLSRFKLDKDMSDLSDNIAGKKAVLDAAYSSEQNFRFTQSRLSAAGTMLSSQIGAKRILETMTSYVPPQVNLTKLDLQPNLVTVSGQASTKDGLAILLARMTADRNWKSIDLSEVLATPTQGIQFTLIAKR